MNGEIVPAALAQFRERFGCPYAEIFIEEDGGRRALGMTGERPPAPDEALVVVEGAVTMHVDLSFGPATTAEERHECSLYATSVANALAALALVRAAEEGETGTLLIVDDDDGIRMLMRHVLERDGFTVIEAANGLLAHARALEFRPDLIVIDWMMPVLDGSDAVARLKADPFTAATPVVMLTSRSENSDKVAALAAGVQDFLAKPLDPATLTASIRQQLRWRTLMADERATVVPSAPPRVDVPDAIALAQFVEVAEGAEERRAFDEAAQAYTRAAELASNPDMGNKFRRLSGKMYLLLAESAPDPSEIQRGYSAAARAFLIAGNMSLAQTALRSSRAAV